MDTLLMRTSSLFFLICLSVTMPGHELVASAALPVSSSNSAFNREAIVETTFASRIRRADESHIIRILGNRRHFAKVTMSGVGLLFVQPWMAGQPSMAVDRARVLDGVADALRHYPSNGLALMVQEPFWTAHGLSDQDARAAVTYVVTSLQNLQSALAAIGAPLLTDPSTARLLEFRVQSDKALDDIKRNPADSLRTLLVSALDLYEKEATFWAMSPVKPRGFSISFSDQAVPFMPALFNDVSQALRTLMDTLRPSDFIQAGDGHVLNAVLQFRAATDRYGFLILAEALTNEIGTPSLHFNIYERDRTVPSEIEEIDGLHILASAYRTLTLESSAAAVTVDNVPNTAPFLAIFDKDLIQSEAQFIVDIRDHGRSTAHFTIPSGWSLSDYRRLLRWTYGLLPVDGIARFLYRTTMVHELVHYWSHVRGYRLADLKQHFGLSQSEWQNFLARSVSSSQQGPDRISRELIAYAGELAFSERPLYDLFHRSEFLTGHRSTVEDIVPDYLFRQVTQKIGFKFNDSGTGPISPQTAHNVLVTLLDSLDGKAGRNETLEDLNERIRIAARDVIATTFVDRSGQPLKLPRTIKTTAMIRAPDQTQSPTLAFVTFMARWNHTKAATKRPHSLASAA